MSVASEEGSLCCCEYINNQGEKQHILQCLCECDALDQACDRLVSFHSIPPDTLDDIYVTCEDRCRIPGLTGKGAIKIPLDVAFPTLTVPICLLIAAMHIYFTCIVIPLIPVLMFVFYHHWKRRTKRGRTRLFFTWGVNSVLFLTFLFDLILYQEFQVATVHAVVLHLILAAMFVMLFLAKRDPGIIHSRDAHSFRKAKSSDQTTQIVLDSEEQKQPQQNGTAVTSHSNRYCATSCTSRIRRISHSEDGSYYIISSSEDQKYSNGYTHLTNGFNHHANGLNGSHFMNGIHHEDYYSSNHHYSNHIDNCHYGNHIDNHHYGNHIDNRQHSNGYSGYKNGTVPATKILEEDVTWIDSRPFKDGHLMTWCDKCLVRKPPRCGHCSICNACVQLRDHHCVWIDSCIGVHNQRPFVLAIILFIVAGFYGTYLTFSVIYDADQNYSFSHWLTLVYHFYSTSLCFVGALYSLLASLLMCLPLFNQLVVISQDLTCQELHQASVRKLTKMCGLYATKNVNNNGILKNLINFVLGTRKLQYLPVQSMEMKIKTAHIL
ncbi:palmitoyltransferase ZDHHC23 isoform X1 [Lingula anatina]|uniref:Palmitoyltransferase n=1 Tax=Lingula anatina TaxID=7574 RepID=A0A2R2MTR1_LINAN|nr:palmitoyltransferase ZDHHC23 isoform X1 [Lingula anatina]XP_023933509.1 palmitoyltransferase ZDHHC23 isoform X1 [Lingula anatina]|eukprot:XP_023933508.1 palmitoyltransferase ZDHHC23 isoform X1 [Lingula anatina]